MFKIGENPTNTLWIEPDYPRKMLGRPYDFAILGDGITRGLILSALVPKSPNGKSRWGHVHVLDVLHQRLFRANKRNNRIEHPDFGDYMYTWDKLDVLAQQAAMPTTSLRNTLSDLRKWGIIYVAQASLSEANSYRLTDSAFKMAQTLQAMALFCQWQHHLGAENSLFSEQQWNVFLPFLDRLPKGIYQSLFTEWMAGKTTQDLIAQWHKSDDGTGQKISPSQLSIRTHALAHVQEIITAVDKIVGDENVIDLSNP